MLNQPWCGARLQWSHLLPGGCYMPQRRGAMPSTCFNGATCCQVDVTPHPGRVLRREVASMEPPVARWMLRPYPVGLCWRGAASMEPPVARWMLPSLIRHARAIAGASMEPPVARWMLHGEPNLSPHVRELQWSHLLPGGCYIGPIVDGERRVASMEPPVARWMLRPFSRPL